MQVDPTPMNVGDGGTVSREIGAPIKVSASMVGNPPQTLPPELRGDVPISQSNKTTTATDCKTQINVCSDPSNFNHCPVVHPPQEHNNAPTSGPPLISSDKRADKKRSEVPKPKADGAGVVPTHQWPCGTKNSPEDLVNPSHSSVMSNKKPHTQTQPVIGLQAGFQCSTLFKPGQHVAFLPSTNFSSPLCKITLPPALGQIAALREATGSQFQKGSQPQSTAAGVAPLLRTYPYHFSVGRSPALEKKTPTATHKLKCKSTSSSKSSTAGGEQKSSIASVVASPTITLPALGSAPPTRFTLSPTAAICCGPSLASITTQGRLLNHVEKGPSHRSADKTSVGFLKLKASSAAKDHAVTCPTEARDVPLDLSAKSKRPKAVKDPPNTVATTEHLHNEACQKGALHPKRPYPILPDTHRNGAYQKQSSRPLNHQGLEPKSSWVKGCSQGPINNLPGTYVGVASPILASTLRSKDGKGSFEDEFQTFARQETISIIDQGEHLATRGKKALFMTKSNQHVHGIKHPNSTSPAVTESCPFKGAFSTALPGSTNSHSYQKSASVKAAIPYSLTVVKPLWQQPPLLPYQGASVQRKISQGTPKVKGATGSEGPKFQSAHQSLSRMSPLSNLESIVKQKALENTALTGEGYCHLSPMASRKAVVSSHTVGQDTLFRQTAAFGCPPIRSVENKETLSFKGYSTQVMNKLEKTGVSECREKSSEKHVKLGEQAGGKEIQVFGSSGSANRNRMDSKLAQELEGGTVKEENMAPAGLDPRAKLEGIALSILTGQCAGLAEVEKKTNGTKEESPTKPKAAFTKQKKSPSPRKPEKEKSSLNPSKKAVVPVKKKPGQETIPVKKEPRPKKKKPCAPVLEHSLSLAEPSPHREEGENTSREKSSPTDNKQSAHNKPVGFEEGFTGNASSPLPSPQCSETPVSFSSPGRPNKEPACSESSTPRLRRGRRRGDEAWLDDWGFAPSPPPNLPHSPTAPPLQPARRPRGRPRTNPLPEKAAQGKARPAPSTEGDALKHKKRSRCRNRKYQNGEYITGKDRDGDGEGEERSVTTRQGTQSESDLTAAMYPRLSATLTCRGTSPEPDPRRPSFTRSGSVRRPERETSPEPSDKPSGKRKFKSKHLSDTDEPKKLKTKRCSLGKRPASVATDDDSPDAKKPAGLQATPKCSSSPPASKKGTSGRGGVLESPPSRPVPPEVRRLIVNKNAGETLLQRAARLGYLDVVLYCLEKDVREVNRRDNAGYTALHEACSRGWSHIVQVLLKHGADVNCSAQDGTRPIHDAVASDNLPELWMLLNHGADPTLATYSGQTAVKLAQSPSMKTFLKEYFTDLEGRSDQDPSLPWDFYSSSVFENGQEACWDFLLSQRVEEEDEGRKERDSDRDCLMFEFSSEPLLPCYHVQVSLTQGFCNWFLLTDVLKRLKMSSRIFRARYPHLEVVSLAQTEMCRQVSVSQVSTASAQPQEEGEGPVELVRCVPELQGLLGSSIHILQEDEDEEEGDRMDTATPCSR